MEQWTAQQYHNYFSSVLKKNVSCSEHEEQKRLIARCKDMESIYPELTLLYAIPNGGHRNKVTAMKLKKEGVKPGVPDLDLPVARGGFHGLKIEMKRCKGGKESSQQIWWREQLTKQGYCSKVCNGSHEGLEVILWYLGLEKS